MFWVNVPFCVVGLVLAGRFMAADTPSFVQEEKTRLDVPGLVLITPAVAALILGLTNAGRAAGFAHADVIIPLAAGVALLAAFTLTPCAAPTLSWTSGCSSAVRSGKIDV
jgi:hypothetical protein